MCLILYTSTINVDSDSEEYTHLNKWEQKSWLTLGDSITKAN